jgi:proteasome lid subunit RPN8/RPN11
MSIQITADILQQIAAHGEAAYPEEGAGFLLGRFDGQTRRVQGILPAANSREDQARHNRYLITPHDTIRAERVADERGLMLLGVFHSHPDHPSEPSEFDREYALPWFVYLITTVNSGKAAGTRAWLLQDDRARFNEEVINVDHSSSKEEK